MENEVKAVLAKVFNVGIDRVDDGFGPGAVADWDSAGHMRLIMALEESFGIMFDDDVVENLVSVASIVAVVEELRKNCSQ